MILLLSPVDTFFFRNHKAFSPGENSSADAVFPPRPGTVYGALRSAYIHQNSDFTAFRQESDSDIKHWMGTVNQAGSFRLKGVFLYAEGQAILPLPMDYQVVKEETEASSEEWAYPLILKQGENNYSSDASEARLYGEREEKSASGSAAFLPLEKWKESLVKRDKQQVYRASQWLMTEDKLGIARDWETARNRDGMLYQLKMYRFKEVMQARKSGLIVIGEQAPDFSGLPFLRLGGKNRPWTVEVLPDEESFWNLEEEEQIIQQIEASGIARMIFITPAIWNDAASSFYIRNEGKFRIKDGLEYPIITEVIGRPELTGGWDIDKKIPKKRMLTVPAGSVYYLEIKKGQARELVQCLKETKLSDELAHEGYGWAVCAAYNEGGR